MYVVVIQAQDEAWISDDHRCIKFYLLYLISKEIQLYHRIIHCSQLKE